MAKQAFKYVGQSVTRVDGIEKVTGKAKFLGDLSVPGMLYGKIVRSSYPHAKIVSINSTKALALEGVVAVLTAQDTADLNRIYSGRPVIAIDKVRYVGEPVAAVAAVDEALADEAASLIEVEYEELPAVVGIDAARAPGAVRLHDDHIGNLCSHESVARGDIERGFAQSDLVLEDKFTFPMVYHYSMEPHAVIAHWNEEGVTVWSSAQHPFQVRNDIAKVFRLPTSRVRLLISYLGGGYGSKSYTKFEPLVAALARKVKAPVRVCNSVG
jgi:CO/xanthine dehydrogenase Mo-binding subunit